jgi:hypothetical protein
MAASRWRPSRSPWPVPATPRRNCEQEIAARALEVALARPEIREALESPATDTSGSWSSPVLRALFPGLDAAIAARVEDARREMERGHFEAALSAFRDAARMDPDDAALQTQLREAEHTVALSRELQASGSSFAAEVAREAEADHVRHLQVAPLEGDFVHTGAGGGPSAADTPSVGSAPPPRPPSDASERLE